MAISALRLSWIRFFSTFLCLTNKRSGHHFVLVLSWVTVFWLFLQTLITFSSDADEKVFMSPLIWCCFIVDQELCNWIFLKSGIFLIHWKIAFHFRGWKSLHLRLLTDSAAPDIFKNLFAENFHIFIALGDKIGNLIGFKLFFQFLFLSFVLFYVIFGRHFGWSDLNHGVPTIKKNILWRGMAELSWLTIDILKLFGQDGFFLLFEESFFLLNELLPVVLNLIVWECLILFFLFFPDTHFCFHFFVNMLIRIKFVILHDGLGFFVFGFYVGKFLIFESTSFLLLFSIGNLGLNVFIETLFDVLKFNGLFLFFGTCVDLIVWFLHVRLRILLDAFCWVRRKIVRGIGWWEFSFFVWSFARNSRFARWTQDPH